MKNLFAGLSMMLALGAFAAECYDTTVYVWSNGSDKYADGTPALDGERYALCWSPDTFGGFNADGTLVKDTDKVLGIAPLAKDGKCRDHIFVIANPGAAAAAPNAPVSQYAEGKLSLWLLDTRVFETNGVVSFAEIDESNMKVASVAGAANVGATIKVQSTGTTLTAGDDEVKATASALPTGTPDPVIKSIKIEGDKAVIEVENTVPYITYDLQSGENPDVLAKGQAEHPVNGAATQTETIKLVKPVKDGGEFFKVGRR